MENHLLLEIIDSKSKQNYGISKIFQRLVALFFHFELCDMSR